MSLTVPLEGFGGGGTSLNFDVKAYASEDLLPSTAKENTIAVITDTPINGYTFSATEPAEPMEGMVWFTTGVSSNAEFNALKKNGIQVCPVSAKQYVDGAWLDVMAQSYQGGEWVKWGIYFISPNIKGDISLWTKTTAGSGGSAAFANNELVLTRNAGTSGSGAYLFMHITEKEDLTAYTQLCAVIKATNTAGLFKIGITSELACSSAAFAASSSVAAATTETLVTCDISNVSEGYVTVGTQSSINESANTVTVKELYFR